MGSLKCCEGKIDQMKNLVVTVIIELTLTTLLKLSKIFPVQDIILSEIWLAVFRIQMLCRNAISIQTFYMFKHIL